MRAIKNSILYSSLSLIGIILISIILFSSCKQIIVNHSEVMVNEEENEIIAEKIDPIEIQAEEIVSSMDDRQLAAQIIISGIDGRGILSTNSKNMLKQTPAGGIMFFSYNLNNNNDAIRAFVNEIVSFIKDETDIPPFIAVDHEGGFVNRFRPAVTTLPAAASYWEQFQNEGRIETLKKIEEDSLKSGSDINALGFNMNFAPVAEYLVDENRRFLINRSYGPDPIFTAQAANAFVRGMEQAGVLCVVKHFPGSAGPDPHHSLSVLNMDKLSLNRFIYPFAVLINLGARAVMAAHTLTPAIDSKIASLSPAVMQNWLRDELGFDGIIISDDFIMAAAGNIHPEEAAVQSITAGSDMILVWPRDLKKTHDTILAALKDGRLPKVRLLNAATRIVYEKIRMGMIENFQEASNEEEESSNDTNERE